LFRSFIYSSFFIKQISFNMQTRSHCHNIHCMLCSHISHFWLRKWGDVLT
jgi:hypothetical protein